MAQLKDSLITGSLRVTDTIYTTNETISSLTASAAVVSDANKNLISRTILNNTSATAVTGSDSLITANTLVNAGYVKSSGVTSITIQTTSPLSGGSATATTNTGSYTIAFSNQTHNTILAGPSATNASATAPSFRTLVAADIPYITTASDTSNELYMLGVTSSATTTVKYNSGVKAKNGAVTATTYNALTLTAATTGFTIAGGTTSKTLTVSDSVTLKTGSATYLTYYSAAGTIAGHPLAHFSDEFGSSVANKKNTLVLGNATAKETNGSSWGQLALYSPGTKGTYLKAAENSTAWYTATLPASSGTICYTDGTGASGTWGISITGASTSVSYQHASIDFSQTNNDLSSNWEKTMCWFGDKNGSGIGRVYFVAKTDGTNQISLQARRWNTSGNAIGSFAGINIISNRSNATTCTIDGITTVSGSITSIGNSFIKHSTIDITSASNNLSSNTGIGFYGVDKGGRDYTRCMSYALTSGETRLYLQVRNHTGSAYTSYGGIIMKANTSDSNISYEVTSAGNFRSAISAFYTGGGTLTGTLIINKTNAMALQIKPYGGTYGTSGEASIWYCGTDATASGYVANTLYIGGTGNQNLKAAKVYGAVWNDYAEFRKTNDKAKPGNVVIDNDDGSLTLSYARLLPGAQVVSDTYGFAIGQAEKTETPLAVSGRVLVYTYQNRNKYHAGQAVCSAPNGTVDIMTRHEISEYPDAIIGIVSEIPEYEEWGTGKVKVDGRIWIKVR